MDADAESRKVKFLLGGFLIFIVSGFISFAELAYLIAGHKVAARVTRVRQIEEYRRSGSRPMQVVEYEFTDNHGDVRKGSDKVAPEWPAEEGEPIAVQYRSGPDGESRLAGHVNWVGTIVFFAATVYLAIVGYQFWREVSEAVGGGKKGRRR